MTANTPSRIKRSWTTPRFVEIRMSAEIGSYQNELEERQTPPPPYHTRRG